MIPKQKIFTGNIFLFLLPKNDQELLERTNDSQRALKSLEHNISQGHTQSLVKDRLSYLKF